MEKFIKLSTVIIGAVCALLFGFGAFLNNNLPSEFNISKTGNEYIEPYGVTLSTYTTGTANKIEGKLMLGNVIPIKNVDINIKENELLVPCGVPFGIKLFTEGVMVVKTESITIDNKVYNPARDSGIEIGDIITHINSIKVNYTEDLPVIINASQGKPVKLSIIRDDKEISKTIIPIDTGNDCYKIGIWVRDSSAGIGTMTFYHEKSNAFGGLGHGICDVDTGELMPMAQGEVTGAVIDSVTRARTGCAGTLNGHHSTDEKGYIVSNCDSGVFGYINASPVEHSSIPVAYKQQVKTGNAQIICTVDSGNPQYYDIEIESISFNENAKTKNIVIEITDKALLEKTNGIVQGMSGSPIIQNGRLVGAVTHVFVNEPTKGYGIFAENMIDDCNHINKAVEKTVAWLFIPNTILNLKSDCNNLFLFKMVFNYMSIIVKENNNILENAVIYWRKIFSKKSLLTIAIITSLW